MMSKVTTNYEPVEIQFVNLYIKHVVPYYYLKNPLRYFEL